MSDFPLVKLKALVQFPAHVYGGNAVRIDKENGNYTFHVDYSEFMPLIEDLPSEGVAALIWDSVNDIYYLAPIEYFSSGGGGGEGIEEAPNDGYQYGRQSLDWTRIGGIEQNSKSVNYTTVITDAQKHMLHPTADTTARTFTLAANASVAYPVGTAISFVNQHGAGVLTIACGDTMYLASAGTTGDRTLAASGVCTALKITATEWIIAGKGLT